MYKLLSLVAQKATSYLWSFGILSAVRREVQKAVTNSTN